MRDIFLIKLTFFFFFPDQNSGREMVLGGMKYLLHLTKFQSLVELN